jgi:hypothetical protein
VVKAGQKLNKFPVILVSTLCSKFGIKGSKESHLRKSLSVGACCCAGTGGDHGEVVHAREGNNEPAKPSRQAGNFPSRRCFLSRAPSHSPRPLPLSRSTATTDAVKLHCCYGSARSSTRGARRENGVV